MEGFNYPSLRRAVQGMTQVRALYNFEAQPNSGELSISADEVLTVVREGIEGGWMEGRNAKGQHGLFPESYVVIVDRPQAKTVPAVGTFSSNLPTYALPPTDDEWSAPPPAPAHQPSVPRPPSPLPVIDSALRGPSTENLDDDDFDDWTDDEDDIVEPIQSSAENVENQNILRSRLHHGESVSGKQGTIRIRNINRFSNFVKSGMEAFVLSTTKALGKPEEQHEVVISATGPQWAPTSQPYSCVVDKPKKESKLKGLKSFIAYSVTSSLSGIQVSRRYKHFDWLYEQMSSKYVMTPLPPLPEKQVAGRYEEDLIEHRKNILQIWVNKICRHPVLSISDVWMHFLTCTDEKQWKNGKRRAEKDEFVGGNFLYCVTTPKQPLDTSKVEQDVEAFTRCMRSLDDSCKVMHDRVAENHKRFAGSDKSCWQKMAAAFAGLGHSFELDPTAQNQGVTAALKEAALVFYKIGDDHDDAVKKNLDPLLDSLFVYKRILAGIPDIINVHKSAVSKLRENERLAMEGRLSESGVEKVKERVDVVNYVLLAEIAFQNRERGEDFKHMMAVYLEKQANFYSSIGKQLESVAARFK